MSHSPGNFRPTTSQTSLFPGFRNVRMGLSFVAIGCFLIVGFIGVVCEICKQYTAQHEYQVRFGAKWEAIYEANYGTVTQFWIKTGISVAGLLTVYFLLAREIGWIPKARRKKAPGFNSGRNYSIPPEARIARYRSLGCIWLGVGVAGLLIGGFMGMMTLGALSGTFGLVFAASFVVFLFGYVAMLAGSHFWLKAKAWPDSVMSIGLAPLPLLFVPFVRLIIVSNPVLIAGVTAAAAILLVAVIATLPDRSGISRRRRRRS